MFTNELILAANTAIEAGKKVMEIFHQDKNHVTLKADGSPVTFADKTSHLLIVNSLGQTPWPVLSEEGDPNLWGATKARKRYWLIDPLDGTKEFINRDGDFAINIALIDNNKPVVGVIVVPSRGDLYAGETGYGAWHLKNIPHTRPLEISDLLHQGSRLPQTKKNNSFVIVASRSNFTPATMGLVAKISQSVAPVTVKRVGSALKFCMVATGEADLYPRLDPVMEWDTAAGQALVESAGGSVRCWPGGTELKCDNPNMVNPGFIAIAPGRDTSLFF